jgi:hypothetical protein
VNHQPVTGRPPLESRDQPDFIRRPGSLTRPSSPSRAFVTSLPFRHRRDSRQDATHPCPASHPRNRRLIRLPVWTARRLRIDAPPSQDDLAERSCSKRWPSSTTVRLPRLPGPRRHNRAARMASPNRCGPFTLVRSMETTEPRGLRRRLNQKPPETSGRVASARPNSARNFRLI